LAIGGCDCGCILLGSVFAFSSALIVSFSAVLPKALEHAARYRYQKSGGCGQKGHKMGWLV